MNLKEGFYQKKARAARIISILKKSYPKAWCTLNYKNAFELLISTILSAQCTDERINLITPKLFSKYPDAHAMAKAPLKSLESIIRPSGFYHSKAKAIKEASKHLASNFGGIVPSSMPSLLSLRGVGRKTANIVLFHSFGKNEGIAVDTHCLRISYRLGLTSSMKNQSKSELELMSLIDKKYWGMYTNWMVAHGRKYCTAKSPKCLSCPLKNLCPSKPFFCNKMKKLNKSIQNF